MVYCQDRNCDEPDEPMPRTRRDLYQVVAGRVVCIGCIEAERDEQQWWAANREDVLQI